MIVIMRWYSRKTHLRGASEPSCGFEKFPSFCRTCDKTCNKAEFLFMALYRCRCGFHTGSPIYKRQELTRPPLKTLLQPSNTLRLRGRYSVYIMFDSNGHGKGVTKGGAISADLRAEKMVAPPAALAPASQRPLKASL